MNSIINVILTLNLLLFIIYVLFAYKTQIKQLNFLGKLSIYLVSGLGHGVIIFENGLDQDSLKLILVQFLAITIYTCLVDKVQFLEPILWQLVCMLFVIGSIILHRLSYDYAYRQTLIFIGALLVTFIVGYFATKITMLDKFWWIYGPATIIVLLLPNSTTNGATNWFEIGGISFQPSEIAKIIFTFFLASIFKKAYEFSTLVFATLISAGVVLILVSQSDLGSAFMFFTLYGVLSYMYSRKRWLSALQLSGLAAGGFVAYQLFSHVRIRILAWLDPLLYIDREGYQISQGLFAFANGKWFGTGLTKGSPKDIPVVDSDFIIAAIGEELGTVFTILLICLYLTFIIILLSQCQKSHDLFNAYIGVGLAVVMGVQGFLIIGGVIKLIPLTGVTLPFVSNGGTSLFVSVIMVGLIEAISKAKAKHEEKQYRAHTIITIKMIMFMLYVVLIGYFVYFIAGFSDQVQLNAYNKRMDVIEQEILRGTIYDRQGIKLAYSKEMNGVVERVYPYNNMFAHVVGYNDLDKSGVESYLNVDLLSGHESIITQLSNFVSGQRDQGSDVYMTLDYKMQEIAFNHLEGKKGAVIAIEPSTGKILAMVSKPDFDPNTINDYYQDLITNDEEATLLNRATSGLYPPGSTFKTITALSYLEQKGDDFFYFCKGEDVFGHKSLHCYNDTAHGRMDLTSAFAMSCNTSFATMAEEINIYKLEDMANRLLFNQELPFVYPYNYSVLELPENISKELVAETSIGQGETLMTPLHNLLLTSAIANGGQLMEPYMVETIVNPQGVIVESFLPMANTILLSSEETKAAQRFMEAVVTDGTGKGLQSDVYSAAGKTGAAENPFGETHAWFVGYAPVENPEIAICVLVENAGSSSGNAVPIAKAIFDYYLED